MTRKGRRLVLIGVSGVVLAAAAALVLFALRDTIVFFNGPTEIVQNPPEPGKRLRLGGLVQPGSVSRRGADVRFEVTDGNNKIVVAYAGLLPDLFREGQGVVAEGSLATDGTLSADNVVGNHDVYYMTKELGDTV